MSDDAAISVNEASLDPEALAAIMIHADASGLDWLRRDVQAIADELRRSWTTLAERDAAIAALRDRIAADIEAAANERDQQIADIARSKIVRRSMTTDGMRRAARIARSGASRAMFSDEAAP